MSSPDSFRDPTNRKLLSGVPIAIGSSIPVSETIASAVGLPAIVVRLPGSNWIQPSYIYLLEKKEDSHVTYTPNRINFTNPFQSFLITSSF